MKSLCFVHSSSSTDSDPSTSSSMLVWSDPPQPAVFTKSTFVPRKISRCCFILTPEKNKSSTLYINLSPVRTITQYFNFLSAAATTRSTRSLKLSGSYSGVFARDVNKHCFENTTVVCLERKTFHYTKCCIFQ